MDLRDSSSNAAREGGSSGDDDSAVSVTATLAKEASVLYQSEKFGECVEVLNQLLQKKDGDPKILHNIALAEFRRDGCSDPKKLFDVLINVKRKCEDLMCSSGEQTDGAAQSANKAISGSKESNNLTNCGSAAFVDEYDASVAALNVATILFHLHEYSKALSVLEPLFQNIVPIDETTALCVCLLLLDVAFVTQDASKFSDVISHLEKTFRVSYQSEGGSTGQQQTSNLIMKCSSIPNSSTADDPNSDGAPSESSLSRTLSDETMEYESLFSTLDNSGQNLSRPPYLAASTDLSRAASDLSTPPVNLKLQLPLYKIQLLLLTRNLKAAKREVKQAMNIARDLESSSALLLKSQLEYARGNYSKAFKLLRASSNQADVGSSIIINNNIGCIYYQQGKHHTSSIFFHKALSSCSCLWKEQPPGLSAYSQDKSLLIAYNCGLQYLACGKPLLAARCFLKASLIFHNRPLLWLRLAECCLVALEKGLLTHSGNPPHDSQFNVQVIGQGKWRQLVLENASLRNGKVTSDRKENMVPDSNAKPKLSLPFARQCLLNALHLVCVSEKKLVNSGMAAKSSQEENESSDTAASKNSGHKNSNSSDYKTKDTSSSQASANGDAREPRGTTHLSSAVASALSDYKDICRRENQKIKQAILVDMAFIELEIGNPLKALSAALSLLKSPGCSRICAFRGHVYAAEALCSLNRPKEAAEHLSIYIADGTNLEIPYGEEDSKQWQANKTNNSEDSNAWQTGARIPAFEEQLGHVFLSPEEARGALYVNLASMYMIQGDLEQASRYAAQALASVPNSQETVLMAIYLDLRLGRPQEALSKLKRCCRVRFLPYTRSKTAS